MQIKHLQIEQENESPQIRQIYLIRNTVNNRYVRLGKNETYYLLSVLGENGSAVELNLSDVKEMPEEFKTKIRAKFEEWGFLDDKVKDVKRAPIESIRKIHIVKFNIEKVLEVIYPVYSKFFSKGGFAVWISALLGVVGYYIYSILTFDPSSSVDVPILHFTVGNIILIVFTMFVSIILHEFAHAVTCIKYGGKVTNMGIVLYYCIPCFYCDVSGVYNIKERKKRAIVGVAGILTNLFIGNIMLLIAIILSNFNIVSILLYYIAIGIIFISIYNLIPFVKLDGYWILSALCKVDNLMDKSVILAYTTFFSRKNLNKINMKVGKRRILSLYGIIVLFFNELFWIYTFYNIKNMFHLNGYLAKGIFLTAVIVILADFVKTIHYYYMVIKNDYNRILIMM